MDFEEIILDSQKMIVSSVKYSFDNWMKIIALGFISLIALIGISNIFLSFFLIIGFIPAGYLLRILKTSFNGSDELPIFNEWMKMFIDGFKVVMVIIIYAIPVIIIALISNINQLPTISAISALYLWGIVTGSNLQIILFFIIGFIELIGIANMALYDGEFKAAFNFSEIRQRISMINWKRYLAYYIIIWIIGVITVFISTVTLTLLVGIFIVPLIIVPYFLVLSTRFLALIFASSESLIP
ncbi:MAG: DUF4013 domain-containing protein [Methanobacterium sp.]|jgi:hypothetical protein